MTGRERILAALPGTQAQLAAAVGLSVASVSDWLRTLVDCDEVHISEYEPQEGGGHPVRTYQLGPGDPATRPPPSVGAEYTKKSRLKAAAEKPTRWRKAYVPKHRVENAEMLEEDDPIPVFPPDPPGVRIHRIL